MEQVFTFEEIRNIEKLIIEKEEFPSLILMENAGKNSFHTIEREIANLSESQTFIICGKGNNAGDGFTLARHMLIDGVEHKVVLLEEKESLKGDALVNFDLLTKCKNELIESISFDNFLSSISKLNRKTPLLIVDAILGTGISGKLSEKYEHVINSINELRSKFRNLQVVSLDIPSGLMSGKQINPVVNADITITMGSLKCELLFGSGKENSGEVYIASIGITDSIIGRNASSPNAHNIAKYISHEDIEDIFPKRKKTSYKYSNGKVLIIGGSRGLSGAVVMSSLSALKSGSGGVCAAFPKSVANSFNKKLSEVMKVELDETEDGTVKSDSYDRIIKRLKWCDAVLLGPGISTNENARDFVLDVIKKCDKNLVIDADGLTNLASDISVLGNRKYKNYIILTPHLGEFSRLTKVDTAELELNRFEILRNFCKEHNVNASLKSETTVSCTVDGEIFINSTGNESLATAGSGDVLSGIVVSMLAQTGDAKSAMICGNYLHGLCADLYVEKYENTQSATPQDFIKMIAKVVSTVIGK